MSPVTPADVLAQRRHAILAGDADGFADLFAPDAVIEVAYAGPPGLPARLEGREAIRASARQILASPLHLEDLEVAELHQTQDPEVVIAEMRTKGTVTTTGRPFTATSIQVLRIRDGQIVLFRDFPDPRGLEDAMAEPRPESPAAPMFTRVISVQATPDGIDNVVRFARQQLPDIHTQPGFKGFYLLTDRDTGDLVTISLWATQEDVEQVEARAAQLREKAEATGVAQPPAKIYQVELAHLA
jgi:uncharacterized protein (TIGR02246 family)